MQRKRKETNIENKAKKKPCPGNPFISPVLYQQLQLLSKTSNEKCVTAGDMKLLSLQWRFVRQPCPSLWHTVFAVSVSVHLQSQNILLKCFLVCLFVELQVLRKTEHVARVLGKPEKIKVLTLSLCVMYCTLCKHGSFNDSWAYLQGLIYDVTDFDCHVYEKMTMWLFVECLIFQRV